MKPAEQNISHQLLTALLNGRRLEASNLCKAEVEKGTPIRVLYETILKPSLYDVGLLWEQNKITVATEHMATAIVEGILNELYHQVIPSKYIQKKVVLACDSNEEHQVGIKMVADIFESKGWESFFLGSGVPVDDLIKYIEEVKPHQIALSLSVYYNFKSFMEMVIRLRKHFPEISILVGGQAFRHLDFQEAFKNLENIDHMTSLEELEDYIDQL
jgi:methanogenic corrinoid protein MtbC1